MIRTRNRIPGKVKSVTSDRVVREVNVETGIGELCRNHHVTLDADHPLKKGDDVFIVIKATERMIENPRREAI